MINTCIRCNTKIIPIVHRLDPEILDLQDKGIVLASLDKTYNSFCPLCEESYRDFTLPPIIAEDMQNNLE
jgi:hypothetical protein